MIIEWWKDLFLNDVINHMLIIGAYTCIKKDIDRSMHPLLSRTLGNCLWIFALGRESGATKLFTAEGTLNQWTDNRCLSRAGMVIALFIAFIQRSMVRCFFSIFHEICICCNVSPENRLNSKNNLKFLFFLFSHFLHIILPWCPYDLCALSILSHKWCKHNTIFTVDLARHRWMDLWDRV